jgi:hypothetical protein
MASTRGQFQVDFLRSVVANGGRIAGARFSLQRGPLKSVDPLYSLTLDQHGVRSLQELAWTSELEKLLLFELRCKVDTLEEEAQRFAAILLNNLRTAETRHGGRDFAHAVLVAVLRDRPEYNLTALLDRTGTAAPSHSSKHYAECAGFLVRSIDGLQNTAVSCLGYDAEHALTVMRDALGILLDETFHISTAALLFPRHA